MAYRLGLRASGLALGFVGAASILLATAVAQQPAARAPVSPPAGFRKLAPGVETTVPRPLDPHDTVTYHDIVELTGPRRCARFGLDAEISARRRKRCGRWRKTAVSSHGLVSAIHVQAAAADRSRFAGPDGRLERKVVWYMVYRVKNIGGHLKPVAKNRRPADALAGAPEVESVDDPGPPVIVFIPKFSLEATIDGQKQVYADRVIPLAIDAIRHREDPNRKLLDSVEISGHPIPLSTATDDQQRVGRGDLGRHRSADRFLLDLYQRPDECLSLDRSAGSIQGGRSAGDRPAIQAQDAATEFLAAGRRIRLLEDEILIGAPADKVAKPADPDDRQSRRNTARTRARPAAGIGIRSLTTAGFSAKRGVASVFQTVAGFARIQPLIFDRRRANFGCEEAIRWHIKKAKARAATAAIPSRRSGASSDSAASRSSPAIFWSAKSATASIRAAALARVKILRSSRWSTAS